MATLLERDLNDNASSGSEAARCSPSQLSKARYTHQVISFMTLPAKLGVCGRPIPESLMSRCSDDRGYLKI